MVASSSVFSQGLDGIVVEKYYQANAADVANAQNTGTAVPLTTNSVTYRVYVDMAAGYRLNSVFGDVNNPLNVTTTTAFFNDQNQSAVTFPQFSSAHLSSNLIRLDSYFTIGAAGADYVGVRKSEDTDGTLGNTQNILANLLGGCFGSPINGASGKDGLFPSVLGTSSSDVGTYPNQGVGTAGITSLITAAMNQGTGSSVVFNSFSGSVITALNGVKGAGTSNSVLIGQFTTNGQLSFKINIQIQNIATGVAYDYFAEPTGGQLTHPTLTLVPNVAPVVSITSPTQSQSIITGTPTIFTANATDANGTLTDVKFYLDGTLLSTDTDVSNASFASTSYTAVAGSHTIYAVATDNDCVSTTSATINFTVANNQAPQVVLSTSEATTQVVGNLVTFTATVSDPEGLGLLNGTGVRFYKNGVLIAGSEDLSSSPYSFDYPVATGAFTITARATDNLSLEGTSNGVIITGLANNPPTVSITSPTSSQSFTSYVSGTAASNATPPASLTDITFSVNAADDIYGNVTQVELFVDATSVGVVTAAPYTFTWASTSGTKTITAVATDNNGATTTSAPLTLVINDALALPYEVVTQTQLCNLPTFCVPVKVSATYTANDIKGYDVVMTYDATKVAPVANVNTGYNVTVNPQLLTGSFAAGTTPAPQYPNPSVQWVDVTAAIQSPGVLNLSVSLTGNAPANAEWNGTNKDIFCVEFARIAPSTPTSAGFQPFEESTVGVSFLQESRITGVLQQPVTSGKMISTTQQNYVANLQYWNGDGAISYDAASPNTYLVTNIQGVLANGTTALTSPGTPVAPVVPNVAGQFTHVLNTMYDADNNVANSTNGPIAAVRTFVPNISIKRDIVNNPNTSVLLVINSQDAVLGKTILLNQPIGVAPNPTTPSVYQMIALDVNRDGVLSAGDISQMQQRTVGILEEFMQAWNYNADGTQANNYAPSLDFAFIDPASLTSTAYTISSNYPSGNALSGGYWKGRVPVVPFFLPVNVQGYQADDSTCPTVGTANYKGIMMGDADGSYATFVANGTVKANETDYILVDLSNAIVEGTKVSVPVSIVSEEPVNGFDLALGLNENTLSFVSAEDAQMGSSSASFYNGSDKTFRHTSFNTNNFTINARVAFFTFETVDGTISEKDFTSELALMNGKEAKVRFTKSSDLTNNNVDIFPNPSNGMFSVTSKVDGRVDIVDVTGKLVHPGVVVKANQMIEVNMPELSAGVYFVRMYSNNAMTTERIVIGE